MFQVPFKISDFNQNMAVFERQSLMTLISGWDRGRLLGIPA